MCVTGHDSSVSKARGNGLDDQILIPGKGNDFYPHHSDETSEAYATFCLIITTWFSVMLKRPEP